MEYLAISTASFCLWDIGPARKLSICKELAFRRVEIALSTLKMLKHFVSVPGLLKELAQFSHVTIHAPWCGVKYRDNTVSEEILNCLNHICKKAAIEAVVFNYDCIGDLRWLGLCEFDYYLENSNRVGSWPEFESALKLHGFSSVLDINRATRFEDYLDHFIEKYADQIREVHVSGFGGKMGRMPLGESRQEFLLDRVRQIEAPFVIEGLFCPGDFDGIKKERRIIQDRI